MYQNYSDDDNVNLSRRSVLIKEYTRVGTEMLTATMNSKEILKTDLVPFLFFRQALEMGDALSILVQYGCINASKPLVRTLLESYFQLAYLFNENEERKSLQFLYHYEKRKKEYYEKLAFPERGGSFFEKLKKDKYIKGEDIGEDQKKVYAENVRKIESILNEEGNREIAEEYLRVENRKKNGRVSYWYELFDGPASVEGISIKLNEASLYQFIYRNCSSYAHSEDIIHANLEPHDEASFGISALRDVRQLSVVTNDIFLLIERVCMLFLKDKVESKKPFAEKFIPLMKEKKILTERLKTEK